MKCLFYLSKLYWIGFVGFIGSLFSDLAVFQLLSLFGLLVFVNIGLNFAAFRCSLLQLVGMMRMPFKFKGGMPSYENYQSANSYCLPFQESWVAVNGSFDRDHSHSWSIPTQRYAYDFLMLDAHGKSHAGDSKDVSNYYCYGKEILAPADGVIVEVKDDSKDSQILGRGRFIPKAKHIAGNYIVIRHSENEYSTLAHLKKGSMKVHVGDVVSKGHAIALCGNSGNSSEPHLHFQLQTGQSFYSSAGLPIRFERMAVSNVSGYERYDPRPHMNYESIPEGYVTRGFGFQNKE